MINRNATLSAVAAFQAAVATAAAALATLLAQREAGAAAAYAAGGAHRQDNAIGGTIGSDRLELELVGRMKSAGLSSLFDAASRAGGVDALRPISDLETVWTQRLDGPLAPFVE